MGKYFLHFKTIKNEPIKFTVWVFTSVILSLMAIWLPAGIGLLIGKNLFIEVMKNNPVFVFSIVFLGNIIASVLNQPGLGANKFASGLRTLTVVIVFMYIIFLAALLPFKLLNNISFSPEAQLYFLFVTLLLGLYGYGFRDADWEDSVDEVRAKEEKDVSDMTVKAAAKTEEGGIKL